MADDTEIKSSALPATNAVQEGAAHINEAGRTGSETAQRTSAAAADTMRHLGDAAGETARSGAHRMAKAQNEIAQDAAKYLSRPSVGSRRLFDSARDWHTFMQLPTAASGGLQEISTNFSTAVERVVQTNLRATQELFRMAGPAAMAELQQRFIRDYVDALRQGSAAIVRAVRQSAEQTLEPLEQRIAQHQQEHFPSDSSRSSALPMSCSGK